MGRLTDKAVRAAVAGRHGDGDGLHLVVTKARRKKRAEIGSPPVGQEERPPSLRKKWVLRYQLNGVRRDMGLGSYPSVGLSDARIAAADARKLIAQNADPLAARAAAWKAAKPIPTFRDIARIVI